MKAKVNAIKNLKKFLHQSEADRHKPKAPLPAPAQKSEEMSPDHEEALRRLMQEK